MREFVDPAAVEFIRRTAAAEDPVLAVVKSTAESKGLPSITPEAGRFLQVLMRAINARRACEIGTCLGYSTIWLARGLPAGAGKVDTIEIDPERAAEAEKWFAQAGLTSKISIHIGKAKAVLPTLPTKAYDLVFIDADKEGMPEYLKHAVKMVRHGGIIAADNIFWGGSTFDSSVKREGSNEIRQFISDACSMHELEVSILPLGDGLMVAWRRDVK